MRALNTIEQDFWNQYLRALPDKQQPQNPVVIASMAGDKRIADQLLEKYLDGRKIAASGLLAGYQKKHHRLPQINDYWIILSADEVPRCIVRTIHVEFNQFKDISERIALAEADDSLQNWRQIHQDFFTPYLPDLNITNLETTEIFTEFFEVVYR